MRDNEKQKGRLTDIDMKTYMARQKYARRDRDTGNSHTEAHTERYNRKRYRQRESHQDPQSCACQDFSHTCLIRIARAEVRNRWF